MNAQSRESAIAFEFSDRYRQSGEQLPFGMAIATGVSAHSARAQIEQAKKDAQRSIADDRAVIEERLQRYETFFAHNNFKSPLLQQFRSIQKKGLPSIRPVVDALLLCEMTTGLLMGVQDLGRVKGTLLYDLATVGEEFEGLRALVRCREGEMVLRDDEGIIASYFQGPDKRTGIRDETRDIVFFCFAAPGIDIAMLETALGKACLLFGGSCEFSETRLFVPSLPGAGQGGF